ncbi:hypothetical protein RCL1_004341 [Eukaryota sp. TZLM3-RCL]
MSDLDKVSIRTRKFMTNRLLSRKQMVVDVAHYGRGNVSKDTVRNELAKMYSVRDDLISLFGFRTKFGGGRTTGFALIYDNADVMKRIEPTHRLAKMGLATRVTKPARVERRQKKNRMQKFRGKDKVKVRSGP